MGNPRPNTFLSTMTVHPRQSLTTNQDRKLLFHMNQDEHEPTRGKDSTGTSRQTLADRPKIELVEPDGIEPTTSCLQSTRSPN